MFQKLNVMVGTNAATRRIGKTAADRARRQNSALSGKSRLEVLQVLAKKRAS
jgi:hypothetical protein